MLVPVLHSRRAQGKQEPESPLGSFGKSPSTPQEEAVHPQKEPQLTGLLLLNTTPAAEDLRRVAGSFLI